MRATRSAMTAKVPRLDEHVLDATEIVTNEAGVWFAHDHQHAHPHPAGESVHGGEHAHRHDHRRHSARGDYDHHPINQPGGGS
jgi:hypothetical protein